MACIATDYALLEGPSIGLSPFYRVNLRGIQQLSQLLWISYVALYGQIRLANMTNSFGGIYIDLRTE